MMILNKSGSTLVTTLLSVAILAFLGTASAHLFFQTAKSENVVRQVSRCEETSKNILNTLKSQTLINTIAPLGPSELSQITRTYNPYSEFIDISTNPVTINQQRRLGGILIDLENLMKSGQSYCDQAKGATPPNSWMTGVFQVADVPGEMGNVRATIRIQNYDLISGAVSCSPSVISLAPLGQQSPARSIASNLAQRASNVSDRTAYKVSVFVDYEGANKEQKGCSSEAMFRYPRVYDLGLNSGSVAINVPAASTCQMTANPGTLTVNPPQNWSDKGIIPLCRDTSTTGSGTSCSGGPSAASFTKSDRWVPCHLVTMCGQNPSSFSYNSNGTISVTYSGLPYACTASVDMQVVDVAWNGLRVPFSSSNVVQLPGCDSCGSYGWLGGSFCPSGAYTSYCSPPPPPPPVYVPPAVDTSDNWYVRNLYNSLLGREPEVSGASFWELALQSGTMSRNEVLSGIATSLEARINAGGSYTQQEVVDRQNSWDTWNTNHQITNPGDLCSVYSTCSSNFGNTGLSSVPAQ